VAIHLDAYVQPRWIGRVVEGVVASPWCEVVCVTAGGRGGGAPSLLGRLAADPSHALLSLFSALDDRAYGRPDDALAPGDVRAALGGVAPADDGVGALDVVLSFARSAVPGAMASRAQHGVWTLHFGPVPASDAELVGLHEVLGGQGVVVTELRSDVDGGTVLARAVSRADVRSVRRGRNVLLLKCAALVTRALGDLQRQVDERASAGGGRFEFRPAVAEGPARPDNGDMARLLVGHGLRYARELVDRSLYVQQWVMAYQISPRFPSTAPFRYLLPPTDRFWADPFAARRGDQRYILFEEAPFATGRGHISVMALRPDGSPGEVARVLERPYHLSYPFLFRHGGDEFMIPETSERGGVEVYRARGFPHGWELVEEMLPGVAAADVTLRQVGDRWWMFTDVAVAGTRLHNEELHIFHAPTPFGPWTPHRRNPVFSDARRSRPAGALIELDGVLYRPAQDSSVRYGGSMSINRVTRLTPDDYEEEACARVLPDWDPRLIATHSLNRDGDLTVIDAGMLRLR
jgi:hypothetical protein